ncbi:MAG: glycosyltransferase [Phycisphaerae bacterium]
MPDVPLLSTVVLNWNREDLLRTTVDSYLATVSVPYELAIVDNASTDGSRAYIESVCAGRRNHRAILLPTNTGGEGLNVGLAECRGRFLQVSENDLEYLPGWDRELLSKFETFPELGQLSPFSPFHQVELGEVWTDRAGIAETRDGATLYWALYNVTSSCLIRREVWERGVRWQAHGTKAYWSPDDGAFSREVKRAGYRVAWNDRYVVVNWGHNVKEMARRMEYYLNNAEGKQYLGVDRLRQALADHGCEVVTAPDGRWTVEQRVPPAQSRAAERTALWREWIGRLGEAVAELSAVVPAGATYLLVDDEQFGAELLPGRRALPFIEADGSYAGAPADDAAAVRELERMRSEGARQIVFMWPCFWWLDHYAGLREHLRTRYACVSDTARASVFDLTAVRTTAGGGAC